MRRDFILPALLFVALTAMVVYVTSAERDKDVAELAATPAACEVAGPVSRMQDLEEASGLAASKRTRGVMWSHNDSADGMLYAIRSNGSLSGRVRVAGATVVDWEAVAVGPCGNASCLYIGDIGDNDRARRTITIYRTVEPAPTDQTTAAVDALEAAYPEGPQDAESLFVARGTLFLVTKGEHAPVRVYRFPSVGASGSTTLELIARLTDQGPDKSARATDTAISPNGEWVAMRTNTLVLFYKAAALLAGAPGTPLAFDLRPLREPQGEGITWADDHTLYLVGEGAGGGTIGHITCALPS